ncbi:MAG: protein translocase subunit SecD [Prosthecobacter sp.]|uniref:protein translocase subunit SecD n=1 Tax=Prosthecobacter sp. TaxID=1965333 RepID=UPI0025E23EC6|nr:protein translocase subunit SecD [Prosthecobacter sp.]MCF7785879.1 protein translocase subunit SecD [Prosthecobacter sp.]
MNPFVTFFVGASILMMLLVYVGTAVHTTKRRVGTLLIILTAFSAIYTIEAMKLQLGIDLQGGSEFIVQLSPGKKDDGTPKAVTSNDVQQAIDILQRRLSPGGEKDLTLQPEGSDRIVIQMPGITEEEIKEVRKTIQTVAHLEFRRVHPDSQAKLEQIKARGGLKEPGWVEMFYKPTTAKDGSIINRSELVRDSADIEGKYVSSAFRTYDAEGNKVSLQFDSTGAKLFDELAAAHFEKQMAIIVDDQIQSAPVLREKQFGGRAVISGGSGKGFTQQEADTLATLLSNPLQNPMKILSESSVSSAYGQSSIDQGKWIGVAALLITTCFMLFIYRLAGIVAIVGLVINIAILFGAMALFGFTLTMPGIAGVVLTIGMAVDANVLIYERLREEMEAGKTFSAALEAAYEKAFSAIADSNITTLISALILFLISGGLVKGFAVTLMIGLISSMIGALIVTRVIFMWVVDKNILKKIHTTKIIPDKVFDILSSAPKFIIASLVVTAISFGTLAYKWDASFGIDFRGGSRVDVTLVKGKNITDDEFAAVFKGLKQEDGKTDLGTYYPQRKSDATGATNISIRCDEKSGTVIQNAVNSHWKSDTVLGTSIATVGSVIGDELAKQSFWAMLAALIAIFLYLLMRYEFAFAVGAIVALFHDVLMVPGLCVLFGQELSIIHVGALLTIAGYSINDTIVVFDRIRETIQKGTGGSMRNMMNEAICKTLSRTLLTGPTALAPMVVLLFLGNPAMLEFAMPITIGVLLGTYSSIFIASPLVLWYAKRTGTSLKHQVLDAQLEQIKADQAIAAAAIAGGKK